MTDRSGKKEKWAMANGNETWIDPATRRNIEKIYDFLLARRKESLSSGKKLPRFSYAQIAHETGITPKQVQFACQKMAFKENPYFKIHAVSYGSRRGVKTCEKVELVRVTISDEGSPPNVRAR